ncbi:protein containing DUF1062 [Pseudovibrio sp. FO-BEG1]|uniref:DUF1062 domain-containing protein n=1 Tax=Pseudovibrio sp. (strain FO-BEG1) TaxID=911045 RepID=UPI000238D667|nr:DUF1062 domain-containing protein [Pseudovibrio sp. FO-BEG1]AEV35844.1 protein containing DUF1062 [Pseudovibrio sp. FO-BEG1]
MSKSLKCVWTLQPENPPRPVIPCKTCGVLKPFKPSGKFRLNANGTKLDAWLIYKCEACDATWNRPIFERRARKQIAPDLMEALQINCPHQIRKLAFDRTGLPAVAAPSDGETAITIHKQIVEGKAGEWAHLEITLNLDLPVSLRLDRLLAQELSISRNTLKTLAKQGNLTGDNGAPLQLKKPPKHTTTIHLHLAANHPLRPQFNTTLFNLEPVE